MRSYFKLFRTKDFKTMVTGIAAGEEIDNYEKLFCLLADAHEWVPPLYNELARPLIWIAYDDNFQFGDPNSSNMIEFRGGTELANRIFDCRPYQDHPLN